MADAEKRDPSGGSALAPRRERHQGRNEQPEGGGEEGPAPHDAKTTGMTDKPPDGTDDRPLVLDEVAERLERFAALRNTDSAAADAVLDELGVTSDVDRDIMVQLAGREPLAYLERRRGGRPEAAGGAAAGWAELRVRASW